MGLDDVFTDFIIECRDYIKERKYTGEIVEKAEIIFDLMNSLIMESWNIIDFPENLEFYKEIYKISLKMRIDMKEKLLKASEINATAIFIKGLEEDREKLKQLEEIEKNKEKEIKCQFCGEIFNEDDLYVRTKTTDIFLGLDWGIPSWKEYEIKSCPDCGHRIIVDNKILKIVDNKIEYQERSEI